MRQRDIVRIDQSCLNKRKIALGYDVISALLEDRDPEQKKLFIDALYLVDIRLRIDADLKLARRLQSDRISGRQVADRISVHVYYFCGEISRNFTDEIRDLIKAYLDAFIVHDKVFYLKPKRLTRGLA